MLASALSLSALTLTGCGHYAEFTLPRLPLARSVALTVTLDPNPVITRGSEHDVLNPSVIRTSNGYANLYSEWDGHTWHTALAVSEDGQVWNKQGRVLSPDPETWEGHYIAANGSALVIGGEWWYWYQAGDGGVPRIGLARSYDGRRWTKIANPVVETGPRGSWDERGAADPNVVRIGNVFYLYYLGQDRAREQQIGLARSSDGVHWIKLLSNPVVRMPWPGSDADAANGLGEPAVWQSHGWYWMLMTGRSSSERRVLILARSLDGVHWTKDQFIRGNSAWNRAVVCDPTVLLQDGRIRLWFGGGDVPRPDENLNGQIGSGEIHATGGITG